MLEGGGCLPLFGDQVKSQSGKETAGIGLDILGVVGGDGGWGIED